MNHAVSINYDNAYAVSSNENTQRMVNCTSMRLIVKSIALLVDLLILNSNKLKFLNPYTYTYIIQFD